MCTLTKYIYFCRITVKVWVTLGKSLVLCNIKLSSSLALQKMATPSQWLPGVSGLATGSLGRGIPSICCIQNGIKWLCIHTVSPLRAVLFSPALRSCSCCSSGWAFCPPSSSPQPCTALLSAALGVWGAMTMSLGPRCHPPGSFFAPCMVPTPGAAERACRGRRA